MGYPRALVAAGSAMVALVVAGCGPGPEASATPDWRVAVGQYVDRSGPLAAPTRLPKGLDNVQAVTMHGQQALTFYSPGEPLVTVCSGNVKRCRAALGESIEIRSGITEGSHFVIALGRFEDPKADPALSPTATKFWHDVRVTASRPQWLPSPT